MERPTGLEGDARRNCSCPSSGAELDEETSCPQTCTDRRRADDGTTD